MSKISIRPGVSVLGILRHLNYQPWYALAEFVDNAIQSAMVHSQGLSSVANRPFKLRVDIDYHEGEGLLVVRDNAAGIAANDYARAFRAAEIPDDRTGLSEFGMGMKSAACWFAPRWTVRTSALGEPEEKEVRFNIAQIVSDSIEELDVVTTPCDANKHFTEVILYDLHRPLKGATIAKIKEHLSDIYRDFFRDNSLCLYYNGTLLAYEEPPLLTAPYYRTPSGPRVVWKKNIDFDLGKGLRARGFAALRDPASTSRAGFALFRRGRLIQGSGDEGYRPHRIFGRSNSYTYQRLFGELHLEGFDVSHTKDGFQWDDNEAAFLELLREELETQPFPLLSQAEGHRSKKKPADVAKAAKDALDNTAGVLEQHASEVIEEAETLPPDPGRIRALNIANLAATRQVKLHVHGTLWEVIIELSNVPDAINWLEVSDEVLSGFGGAAPHRVGVRMALQHPFMDRFCGDTTEEIEPILRIAVALGLGEKIAYDAGVNMASSIRRNVNKLLRDALSGVIEEV